MAKTLSLRAATLSDAEILLAWRNDPETRAASHNSDKVSLSNHLAWLESSLKKPEQRRLWLAEKEDKLVGTCRADREGDTWELSWTVAPEARGQGVAYDMVSRLVKHFDEPLTAQIKTGNMASMKVAEKLGFKLVKEENGVLFYRL